MSSSTLDFFSAFDVEDDVNELLGGIRPSSVQQPDSITSNAPNTISTSPNSVVTASSLLSRIMQQQQQQLAAAAASSAQQQDTDDNWTNTLDFFEMSSSDNHRRLAGTLPFIPPPPFSR
mmetsp:Transcript_26411/g.56738  ORF Transcript_26411/g.56738 Transcript_26411/m.56738 type:complete len:119 (+) Transcript_26411:274-630(+)